MDFLLINHAAALFLTAATALFVGLFVLAKSRGSRTNKVYAVWSFSVSWWSFAEGLMIISDSQSEALFFGHLLWLSVLFIAVSTAHFVILFLGIKGKEFFIKIGYVLCFIFATIALTPYAFSGLRQVGYIDHFTIAGIFIYLNAAVFFVYLVYQLYCLYQAKKHLTGVRRTQVAYLFWASLLGYIGGLTNYILAFDIYIPIVHPFATYLIILYSVLVALAIFKYQLMDIRFVVKKALFYSTVIALAGIVVLVISLFSDWLAYNVPIVGPWTVPFLIGIVTFIVVNLYWRKSKQVEESYAVEKKAHKELVRLSEVKDEFILATQHHLRTPLSIIKGYLAVTEELLAKKDFNKAEVREYLHKTAASADRLNNLVNELLDITQMEMGTEVVGLKATNPKDIIEGIVEEMNAEIKKKKLHIQIIPQVGWPKLMLDQKKIKMAFFNLIDNAIKYTKEGSIIITGKRAGDFYRISFRDTGIGIKASEIKTIFEKYFERGKRAKELNVTGRGIGLYIAASSIRDHGGRVSVRSEGINHGSEFIVDLPLEHK